MMVMKVLTKIEVRGCVCVCLTWPHSDISGVFINDLDLLREAVLLHNALGCLGHGLEDLEQVQWNNVNTAFKNKPSRLTIIPKNKVLFQCWEFWPRAKTFLLGNSSRQTNKRLPAHLEPI